MDQKIKKCIDKKVLSHFNHLVNNEYSEPEPKIFIYNSSCMNNGEKIAKMTAEKINKECPELKARYFKDNKMHWIAHAVFDSFVGGDDYRQYSVEITEK
jgi:flavorubredoxin